MPVPNSKGEDITKRIEEISKRSDVSPFEVKSLQRDIDNLMAVDAAEAYMLGGMLAAMTGNRAEAQALHEKSLRLKCDVVGLFNFGVSMKKVNNLSLAKELFSRADAISPGDLQVASHRFQTMNFLLDYEEFEDVMTNLQKAHPGINAQEIPEVQVAQGIIDNLSGMGVSLGEYRRFGQHAEQALLQFDLSATHIVQRVSSFDGVPHIYAEYHVEINSADVLVEANEALLERILGDESLANWDKVIINIVRRDQDQLDLEVLEHTAA